MNINKDKNRIQLNKMVGSAIFSALAFVVALVCNIIPPVAGFLSLDVKDAIIAIASFIYGPISAVVISFIAAFIELVTFSTTGWYGFIMNFASSAVFSLTASLIYKLMRNIKGALLAFLAAVAATTGTMLLLNIFVTPIYLQYIGLCQSAEEASSMVIGMLPVVLLPFNFAKSLMNSAVAMMLYKPLARALKSAKLSGNALAVNSDVTPCGDKKPLFNKNTAIILTVGTVTLACAIMIILLIK